jgi:NADH:ubiquinone oxidoreductase subunit 3 (subunit A)
MYHEFCEVLFDEFLPQCGLLLTVFRNLTKGLLQLIFNNIMIIIMQSHVNNSPYDCNNVYYTLGSYKASVQYYIMNFLFNV